MAELTVQVSASASDGSGRDGDFSTTGTTLYIGNIGGNSYLSFFLFVLNIPADAVVASAKLQLQSTGFYSATTVNVRVGFEAADNPSAPTTWSDANGRTLGDLVSWSGIGTWSNQQWYDTPDLTEELQAIIDRPGWSSGQNVLVLIKDNASSSGARRQLYGYDFGSVRAARIVVSYSVPVNESTNDGSKFGDAASADFKSRGEVDDGAGISDAVEGYDFKGEFSGGAGIGDAAAAEAEFYKTATDAAGLSGAVDAFSLSDSFNFAVEIGDAVDAGFERVGEPADAVGIGDAADAFNWTTWLRDNRDQAVARFYLTLTGAEDGTTDVEIPISSFQARKRTGYDTYISAVIIGADYAEEIADRSNGQMIVEMAYLVGGVESIREEILRADIEKIMIQKSPSNRSITLYGRRSETFVAKAAALTKPIYSSQYEGRMTYRFAVPDPYLNPGDSLTVEDDETTDELTVDQVTYYVSATGGTTSMEVTE